MRACARCGGSVERRFRFCPWCAAPVRLKLVEFFRPHPGIASDRGKALRVSRYVDGDAPGHVRFSIWHETGDRAAADAAVSLGEDEAARLAAFLRAGPDLHAAEQPSTAVRALRALRHARLRP